MLPPWKNYHDQNKNKMSMTQMVRQYTLLSELEHTAGNPYGFILQENLDYLLQEDGSRIFWN